MKRMGVLPWFIVALAFIWGCAEADPLSRVYEKHESDIIKSASYDKITQKMKIGFTDGSEKIFDTVPSDMAATFLEASAPDKIFNQKIKGKSTSKDTPAPK